MNKLHKKIFCCILVNVKNSKTYLFIKESLILAQNERLRHA